MKRIKLIQVLHNFSRNFSVNTKNEAKSKFTSDPFDQFGPVLNSNIYKKNAATSRSSPRKLVKSEPELKQQKMKPQKIVTEHGSLPSFLNPSRITEPDSVGETPGEVLRIPYEHNQPSVSKILSATMSEESRAVLARWERDKISLLGEDGFKKYKSDMFNRGKTLHSILETFLETRTLPRVGEIEDQVSKRHIVSLSQMIHGVSQPLAIESCVVHEELGYSGILDCVALINNTITLIDWKTSERVKQSKESLYDNPFQLAAYIGALNNDPRYHQLGNISHGAVVVVYNSGYPAMCHTFSEKQLDKYWRLWCQRLDLFKSLR